MNRQITKALAVLSAVCITAGTLMLEPGIFPEQFAGAKTLSEIEAEKNDKQNAIEAKKQEIEKLASDISKAEQYQTALQEEIDLINGKMLLIDTQLQNVNLEVEQKTEQVAQLETDIADQQSALDDGLNAFKARIRTAYIYGNDSVLSALIGASDFYDVLAKMDLIDRIAKRDDEMVDSLKEQLDQLHNDQQELNTSLQALNIKQTEMEALRKEFSDSRTELDAAYEKSAAAQTALEGSQKAAEYALHTYEEEYKDLEEEEEAIILEAARKAAEEARKRAEEEARRKAEEERRRQEAEQSRLASIEAARTTTTTTTTTRTTSKNDGAVVTTAKTTAKTTVTTAVTTATTKTTTKAPVVTTPPSSGSRLAWPAPGFYHISSPFGTRYLQGRTRMHNGIDIAGAGIHYANACAAAGGTVIVVKTGCSHDYGTACRCNSGYGNYVQIDHGNGICTLYAHLASVNVSPGQQVSTGTVVGKIGATGNVVSSGGGGYHLHFSVIVNGTFVNPMPYLQ